MVYVRKEHLIDRGGLFVPTQSDVAFADISKGSWDRGKDGVPVYVLKTEGSRSAEAAAVALTAKENDLADSLQLLQETYTIILGGSNHTCLYRSFMVFKYVLLWF